MKTFLPIFDDGNDPDVDLQAFTDRLDEGAQIYTMDGHVCFIRSGLDAATLTDRFLPLAGSKLSFVTEVSTSDYGGNMVGWFWECLKGRAAMPTAA